MAFEHVAQQLQRLGMSGYEAKAYVALVAARGPRNGYEVAKLSGVPRGTVYETLDRLVGRGAAFEVRGEDGTVGYTALPAQEWITRLRHEFDDSITLLDAELSTMVTPQPPGLMHHVRGERPVLARARDVINSADGELYISIWPEEEVRLADALAAAEQRKVEVWVVSFSEHPQSHGHTFAHHFAPPETVLERVGARLLVAVADRRAVLIGGAIARDMWGVYTEDPAVILLAVEFIRHDIAMQVLVDKLGTAEVTNFWNSDPTLVSLAHGHGTPALDARRLSEDDRATKDISPKSMLARAASTNARSRPLK